MLRSELDETLWVCELLFFCPPTRKSGCDWTGCSCLGAGAGFGGGGGGLGAGGSGGGFGGEAGLGDEKHILFLFHLLCNPLDDMTLTSSIHDLFDRHVRSRVDGWKSFVQVVDYLL